jgi:hypothetical protein
LEVVRCCKVVWPCHHRILGFFGLWGHLSIYRGWSYRPEVYEMSLAQDLIILWYLINKEAGQLSVDGGIDPGVGEHRGKIGKKLVKMTLEDISALSFTASEVWS